MCSVLRAAAGQGSGACAGVCIARPWSPHPSPGQGTLIACRPPTPFLCCQFVDGIKSRLVPAHMRPPPMAINWIPPTGDTEVDSQMEVGLLEGGAGLAKEGTET